MAGSRINQAKNALQLFIRSIPVGSLFNSMQCFIRFACLHTIVVGFGSKFERLFPSSVVYNDNTFKLATQHVANLKVCRHTAVRLNDITIGRFSGN